MKYFFITVLIITSFISFNSCKKETYNGIQIEAEIKGNSFYNPQLFFYDSQLFFVDRLENSINSFGNINTIQNTREDLGYFEGDFIAFNGEAVFFEYLDAYYSIELSNPTQKNIISSEAFTDNGLCYVDKQYVWNWGTKKRFNLQTHNIDDITFNYNTEGCYMTDNYFYIILSGQIIKYDKVTSAQTILVDEQVGYEGLKTICNQNVLYYNNINNKTIETINLDEYVYSAFASIYSLQTESSLESLIWTYSNKKIILTQNALVSEDENSTRNILCNMYEFNKVVGADSERLYVLDNLNRMILIKY